MRLLSGLDRVDRDLEISTRPIFESYRHAETGSEFAVQLALCSAGPHRAPADEIGIELRTDRVQKLSPGCDAFLGDLEEELAGDGEAFVDVVGLIEMRVVDEALPADRRSRRMAQSIRSSYPAGEQAAALARLYAADSDNGQELFLQLYTDTTGTLESMPTASTNS